VTCSAKSLSIKQIEQDAAAINLSELLRPPPAVGDESSVKYDTGTGLSLAKKNRIIDTGIEEPSARPSKQSSVCSFQLIRQEPMNPFQFVSEFLSGSSTSPTTRTRRPASTTCQHGRSNPHGNTPSSQHSKNSNVQHDANIAKGLIMQH
jgi:hypothetical protein